VRREPEECQSPSFCLSYLQPFDRGPSDRMNLNLLSALEASSCRRAAGIGTALVTKMLRADQTVGEVRRGSCGRRLLTMAWWPLWGPSDNVKSAERRCTLRKIPSPPERTSPADGSMAPTETRRCIPAAPTTNASNKKKQTPAYKSSWVRWRRSGSNFARFVTSCILSGH